MRVSLVRSGGFTGRTLSASLDTDELPEGQMTEAIEALDALVSVQPCGPSSPGGGSSPDTAYESFETPQNKYLSSRRRKFRPRCDHSSPSLSARAKPTG